MKPISRWACLTLAAATALFGSAGSALADGKTHWRLFDADHTDAFRASLLARYDYTDAAQVWFCEPAAGASVQRL